MIVSRNVFQLKFGKAKDAAPILKKGLEILNAAGLEGSRILTDLTGPFYTVVLENSYTNLAAMESALSEMRKSAEWQKWYASFTPLIESGHREVYSVVG